MAQRRAGKNPRGTAVQKVNLMQPFAQVNVEASPLISCECISTTLPTCAKRKELQETNPSHYCLLGA